jgi:Spy/CpxP family protein refolding chaperone
MDIFTQKKKLVRIVIILMLVNVIIIGAYLWNDYSHKPPPPNCPNNIKEVSEVLKKELNLTDKQVEQINQLRTSFFVKEEALVKIIREERDSMNLAMFNKSIDEELVKSLARKVAENEYQMEMLRFQQAQDFKSICTPEQLEKFNGLVIEIRDYFRPDNQPKIKRKPEKQRFNF